MTQTPLTISLDLKKVVCDLPHTVHVGTQRSEIARRADRSGRSARPSTPTARAAHVAAHAAAASPAIARAATAERALDTRRARGAAVDLEPRGAAAGPPAVLSAA